MGCIREFNSRAEHLKRVISLEIRLGGSKTPDWNAAACCIQELGGNSSDFGAFVCIMVERRSNMAVKRKSFCISSLRAFKQHDLREAQRK